MERCVTLGRSLLLSGAASPLQRWLLKTMVGFSPREHTRDAPLLTSSAEHFSTRTSKSAVLNLEHSLSFICV